MTEVICQMKNFIFCLLFYIIFHTAEEIGDINSVIDLRVIEKAEFFCNLKKRNTNLYQYFLEW